MRKTVAVTAQLNVDPHSHLKRERLYEVGVLL